MKTACFRKFC